MNDYTTLGRRGWIVKTRRKPGTDMNFRRLLPEIRCLSQGLPRGIRCPFVVSPRRPHLASNARACLPRTARMRMFASRTSISGFLLAALLPEPLEVVHQFLFTGTRRRDHRVQLLSSGAKSFQIRLARLRPSWQVDADGCAMPCD